MTKHAATFFPRANQPGAEGSAPRRRITKKDLAASLFRRGDGVENIAFVLDTTPSYVANTLIDRGYVPDYGDLYTSTSPSDAGGRPPSPYADALAGVLRFRDLGAAQASVTRLDELHQRFAAAHDRRGMHQCQVLALIGKNRAEGIGKRREARLFAQWLPARLLAPDAA